MKRYRVKPDHKVKLADYDPSETAAFPDGKQAARDAMAKHTDKLVDLQERLHAEHRHKLLIILQGMDTAGKDGTIRRVFDGVNPQGVKVASFKQPTPVELAHDYLWRIHPHVPAAGEIVIFNRSHYEDVLVVRVHDLVPKSTWSRRYEHINQFERMLADEGTTILKFFLHISKNEQKQRLQERLDTPDKQWKISPADAKERLLWPKYMQAYDETLARTSTAWAPWYVIPADHKWYRNYLVGGIIVDALRGLRIQRPQPQCDLSTIKIV